MTVLVTPTIVSLANKPHPLTGDDLNLVDQGSKDWAAMWPYWEKVGDIIKGAAAMREKHATYLPKFPNETAASYNFRWSNAKFTNVYRDIVEGLASKPFEQEVKIVDDAKSKDGGTVTIPQKLADFEEDVDGSGTNLTGFAWEVLFDGINDAINWIFVDYPTAEVAPAGNRSQADEARLGIRPFWLHIKAASVLEVKSENRAGKETLTYFRSVEWVDSVKHVRIMRMDGNIARWYLYQEVKDKAFKFELVKEGVFSIGILPVTPMITGRRIGRTYQFNPVLNDAVDLQIEMFQEESGLKNLLALSGFPMLAGQGVAPETLGAGANKTTKTLQTGPDTVLYAPPGKAQGQSAGRWEFVSPDAAILDFHERHINKTEEKLRELGRNPLTAQSANITVITAGTAAQKSNSAVQAWAYNLKNALENAMVITGMWLNISRDQYDPEISVFTDFNALGSVEDLKMLLEAFKDGAISRKTLWHEMERRGLLSGEFDPETEIQRLLEDMISSDGAGDGTNPDDPDNQLPSNNPQA